MPKRITIELPAPTLGKVDTIAKMDNQPRTTVDCLNVLPKDRGYRRRVSSRPGFAVYSSGYSGTISAIGQITYNSGGTLVSKLVVITSTKVYANTTEIGSGHGLSGTLNFSPGKNGIGYLTGSGGTAVKEITFTGAGSIATLGGSTPAQNFYTSCIWRNRLVVAERSQAWYMSEVGNHSNFATSGTDPSDPSRPMSGAVTGIHQAIDAPIVAMIPFTEDRLLVGGDRRFWEFRGDPADGGHILIASEATGIASRNAWCNTPDGLHIVGSGGMYKFNGADFEPISIERLGSYFRTINRDTAEVTMAYDRDRHGIWIYSSSGSMFYDMTDGGFWPQSFASTPTATFVYDGPAQNDRTIYFGSGSTVYYSTDTTESDGAASYYWLGPIFPFGMGKKGRMLYADVILGPDPGALSESGSVGVYAGSSPTAAQAASVGSVAFSGNDRQARTSIRSAASCFMFKVNTYNQGIERVSAEFVEAGEA